jgi:SagB-type dehydrogenase family enzyme
VIFTSGSTGVPKGVAIDHRAALNTILDVNRRFGIGPGDRVLALSSLSFDLSVWDIFGVLGAGGALVFPEADRDPAVWARRVVEGRVTVWNSVPALLGIYVEYLETHPEQRPAGLRLAMLSGDWTPLTLPDRVRAQVPGLRVVSLGGATEASIWSILHEIGTVQNDWASIPYGRPMAGQTFHVLDEALEPRPAWVPGMLWIGGAGLARGYWRDDERTAAAFVHRLETGAETGERLYRTGDLGRRWPDGTIEILGREDFQVKIQGYRIELGEIEAALRDHPEVREAVAVAAGDPGGERRLVAFVTADPGGEAETRSVRLRAWLEARLPRWMVPATITEVPTFPLSASGKVDRAALLRTEPKPAPAPAAPAPATDLTRRIARLVAEALGSVEVDPEGLHAGTNLLELGASSLEVIRLANRLEEELGERPPIQSFYAAPTLGTLIRFYEDTRAPAAPAPAADFELILAPAEREAFKNREPGLRPFAGRESLALPPGAETLEALYRTRVTHRVFAQRPVPLVSVAGLLAALRRAPGTKPKYLFPSAGALYPVQTYLHVKAGRIDGLGAGTWYYHPAEHRLVPLTPGADLDPGIHDPFVNRPVEAEAAFTLFLVADLAAIAPIYGAPALNYALLEAGAMLQLLLMVAPDRGLGLCPIGQVDFPRVRGLFDLGPSHVLLHTVLGGGLDPERESAPEGLGEAYPWVVRIEGDREEGEL